MAFADISDPAAVWTAVEEFDRLGEPEFLRRYGFGPALRYHLIVAGRRYPSKAILGAAHGLQFPDQGPLKASDFSGGEQTVRRKLNALGFDVEVLTVEPGVAENSHQTFAIAVTDLDWFHNLRASPTLDLVNFWTPTPWGITRFQPGDRLYFLLKAPIRKIAGYGRFVRYIDMSPAEAWQAYGLGNGVDSLENLTDKVDSFAERRSADFVPSADRTIGCIELTDVVTLEDGLFVTPEECGHDFPPQIVKLKYFNGPDGIAPRISAVEPISLGFELVQGKPGRRHTQSKDRKGQASFRQEVLRHYGYRCCVTGEAVVELLEAAHIQPYIDERSNHAQNGLCLRVDLHRLFDNGLLSIDEDGALRVSSRLSDSWYAALDGSLVALPRAEWARPAEEALAFHRTNFR